MTRHPSIVTWRGGKLSVEGCDCMNCNPPPARSLRASAIAISIGILMFVCAMAWGL